MILQNCVVCEEFLKLADKVAKYPELSTSDSGSFASSILEVMRKEVIK
jgi:hypothetical protein